MENNNVPQPPPTPQANLASDHGAFNDNTALQMLADAATVAQKRGAFDLNEAANVWNALKYFVDKQKDALAVQNNKPALEPLATN